MAVLHGDAKPALHASRWRFCRHQAQHAGQADGFPAISEAAVTFHPWRRDSISSRDLHMTGRTSRQVSERVRSPQFA
jgi:hypothetical protein